jgi:hypothetical protein
MRDLPRGPWPIAALLTVILAALVYWIAGAPPLIGIDDANITQVYARNLAQGAGYVYTPGFEHVEGATSPLWTLINMIAFLLSAHPERLVFALSLLLATAALALPAARARAVLSAAPAGGLQPWHVALAWAACQPSYFTWTSFPLMDQPLWAFAVSALVVGADRAAQPAPARGARGWLAAAAAFACVTRPEAFAVVPWVLGLAGVAAGAAMGWREAIRRLWPGVAGYAASVVGLTGLRLAYFGVPLPNTYYAKVSSAQSDNLRAGLAYVAQFCLSDPLLCAGVASAFVVFAVSCAQVSRAKSVAPAAVRATNFAFIAAGSVVGALLIQCMEGGDHFTGFRLLIIYVPLIAIPFGQGGRFVLSRLRLTRLYLPGLAAALGLAWEYAHVAALPGPGMEVGLALHGRLLGLALNAGLPPPLPTVGVTAAGGVALTYHGRVLDELGLNWPEMAHASGRRTVPVGHSAFDPEEFWREPADILLPAFVWETKIPGRLTVTPFQNLILKNILLTPRFRAAYAPGVMPTPYGPIYGFFATAYLGNMAPGSRPAPVSWGEVVVGK